MNGLAIVNVVGIAMFATSAGLLALCSVALARHFGANAADRFWIAIAAAAMQIGTAAVVLSPSQSLTPIGFLLVQLLITAMLVGSIRLRPIEQHAWTSVKAVAATRPRRVLLFFIAMFLALGLWVTIAYPIHTFDDRMYRASRAAYWLQHQSLLPWATHNDRQTAFPFGGESVFFWPVLFTRSELPGRLAFFCGVPLCAIGLYTVMRQARIAWTASLAGVLVLLATPTFVRLQDGLYPEVWLSLFALGSVYFALRAARDPSRAVRHLALVGCFVALEVNVKTTALALVPAMLIVPWLVVQGTSRLRALTCVLVGAVAGAVLSGLAFTLAMNVLHEGHLLGPPGMTAAHKAEVSATQLRTHAGRFLVGLLELPLFPIEPVRQSLDDAGNGFLRLLRADRPLPDEQSAFTWPGPYHFGIGPYATRFSLAGLLWLPGLAIAAILLALGTSSRRRLAVLLLFAISMLLPSIAMIRWMGGMDRFFLPAFVLSLPILAIELQYAARRWRWMERVILAAIALTVVPVLLMENAEAWRRSSPTERELDEPFHSALAQLPPGSHILLVAELDVRDYGLFRPREGFANHVVPWGHEPFDAGRMQRLIEENQITHVLMQREGELSLHWRPSLDTRPMMGWLTQQPTLEERPEPSPGMRLFARRKPGDVPSATIPDRSGAATMPLR